MFSDFDVGFVMLIYLFIYLRIYLLQYQMHQQQKKKTVLLYFILNLQINFRKKKEAGCFGVEATKPIWFFIM